MVRPSIACTGHNDQASTLDYSNHRTDGLFPMGVVLKCLKRENYISETHIDLVSHSNNVDSRTFPSVYPYEFPSGKQRAWIVPVHDERTELDHTPGKKVSISLQGSGDERPDVRMETTLTSGHHLTYYHVYLSFRNRMRTLTGLLPVAMLPTSIPSTKAAFSTGMISPPVAPSLRAAAVAVMYLNSSFA